jgi:hypothetical protein
MTWSSLATTSIEIVLKRSESVLVATGIEASCVGVDRLV